MLQRRSPKLSANQSKRLARRFRHVSDKLKNIWPKAAIGLGIILLILFAANLFRINKIDCELNAIPCPAEIEKRMSSYKGQNAILLNQKKMLADIKNYYPADNLSISFRLFNKLKIKLAGNQVSIPVETFLVISTPFLTMDEDTSSSSASWNKPTEDLMEYVATQEGTPNQIWSDGSMTPAASASSNVAFIFTSKPDKVDTSQIFSLLLLSERYVKSDKVFIVNNRVFLREQGRPDIIVYVPFEKAVVEQALQSLTYLSTIKDDTKVIDLSFKHPIIR